MRLVFLDTGTLGMVANPRGTPRAVQCQRWTRNLLAAGVRVFLPEICDNVGHLARFVDGQPWEKITP